MDASERSLHSDGWRLDREGDTYICKVRTDGTESRSVLRKAEGGSLLREGDSVFMENYDYDTMTVIGDWIYYLKATESGKENGLYKVRTDGTEDTLLAKGDVIWRVSVVGDWIFYMLKGEAYRVRTDGAQRTKIRIDYEIEYLHDWGEPYFFTIGDIMVDGEHMYLRNGFSDWFRFDMDMRNEVRLNFRGEFLNVSDGWLYYSGQIEGQNHGGLFRSRLDSADTVMIDGWSSPQIDVSANAILLSELPGSYYGMKIAATEQWLYCTYGGGYGKIRIDGKDFEDISGTLFSKWGVMVMPRSVSVPWEDTVIELGIEKEVYTPGETITVAISGITQDMADNSAYVDICDNYFTSVASGERSYPAAGSSTLTFTAPNEEGAYNIDLFIQDPSSPTGYAIIAFIDFAVNSDS